MMGGLIGRARIIGDRIIERPRPSGRAATVTPIPVLARRAFIVRVAKTMQRKRSYEAGEKYLANELRCYRKELQATGIPRATITRELHALEPAVRGELWRLMFGPLSGTGRRR